MGVFPKVPVTPVASGVDISYPFSKDGLSEWVKVVRVLKLEKEVGFTVLDRFVRTLKICRETGLNDGVEAAFKVSDERVADG